MTRSLIYTRRKLDNILSITVTGRKGILLPNEKRLLRVRVYTKEMPCFVHDFVVTCEIISLTKSYKYKESLIAYEAEQKRIADEFTIADNMPITETPIVKVSPKPTRKYMTLSVSCVIQAPSQMTDLKEKLRDQLEQNPSEEYIFENLLQTNNETNSKMWLDKEHPKWVWKMLQNILEHITSEIITCEEFKWNMRRLAKKPKIYYDQISPRMSCCCNFEIPNKYSNYGPRDSTMAKLLHTLSLQCLIEIFSLEPDRKDNEHAEQNSNIFKESSVSKSDKIIYETANPSTTELLFDILNEKN